MLAIIFFILKIFLSFPYTKHIILLPLQITLQLVEWKLTFIDRSFDAASFFFFTFNFLFYVLEMNCTLLWKGTIDTPLR